MKIERTFFGSGGTDTVIYAPYTWGSNPYNDGGRYEALARATRFDVVTVQAPGTGRVIIDRDERRQLRPHNIRELAEQHAELITKKMADYRVRLGLGDSARGTEIAAVLALAEPDEPVLTHGLIRDGINLCAPERFRKGFPRVQKYGDVRFATDNSDDLHFAAERQPFQTPRAYLRAASEALTHRKLLCSEIGMRLMVQIAERPDIPLHHVGIGYGITGTGEQAQQFNDYLACLRRQTTGQYDAVSTQHLGFLGTYEPAWGHGDLVDAAGAADHIHKTLELSGPVFAP